jgi:DDB1- and CUL4-associated factor 11
VTYLSHIDVFYFDSESGFRNQTYRNPRHLAHPQDCSVMTYRGHSVLQTLIRCYFSPMETTGGQYIYSGSADGRIHVKHIFTPTFHRSDVHGVQIWSLDGRVVQVLDRSCSLPMSFDPSGPEPESTSGSRQDVCVRDVSWSSRVCNHLYFHTYILLEHLLGTCLDERSLGE